MSPARANDVDADVFRTPVPAARTSEQWAAITLHLRERLERFLETELVVEDSTVVDGVALSVTVCSRREIAGPLRLRYRGTVGIESIDDAPYVNALLFVYSSGRRLSAGGDEASFLACIYERSDEGVGHWRLLGWQSDEYGEFSGFAELPG